MRHLPKLALVVLLTTPVAGAGPELGTVLFSALGKQVETSVALDFSSTHEGWRKTGLTIEPGRALTFFAFDGDTQEAAEGWRGDLLWARIGGGDVFAIGGRHQTMIAAHGGGLELAVRPRGQQWEDCSGALDPLLDASEPQPLDLRVVVAVWLHDPASDLEALAQQEDVAAALAAWRDSPRLPAGFQYLCYLPPSEVFSAWEEGERRGIRGLAPNAVGIVKRAVDLPLDAGSEISFSWRYDSMPARGPENDARFHDYSSIAVEFDNGQDLTWLRSSHVAAGTDFACPLEWWDQRETHVVLEKGGPGAGWSEHRRQLAADYERAVRSRIGGPLPKRIVGVWFITVGVFGGGTADAVFADVRLRSAGREVDVFAPPASSEESGDP